MPDSVVPIPDSSRDAALAMATELGVPYREGLVKNRYIGRTFIMPEAQVRRQSVRRKLNPIRNEYEGANVLLVDEINRATPRTQSALLEAMSEGQISVEGETTALPEPFFMLATENPVEFEGTFPLPEAQRDRFFLTLRMGYPSPEAEQEILHSQRRLTHPVTDLEAATELETVRALQRQVAAVAVEPATEELILDLVERTRHDARLAYGASPRASMALYQGAQALAAIRGKGTGGTEEVRELAPAILLKRIGVKPEQLLRGLEPEAVIDGILNEVLAARGQAAGGAGAGAGGGTAG